MPDSNPTQDLLDGLVTEGSHLFVAATGSVDRVDGMDVQVFLGLFAKASRTLQAITLLYQHRLGNEALALQRSLLEAVVHFKLLAEEVETTPRSQRYCQFSKIQLMKFARALSSTKGLEHFTKAADDFDPDQVEQTLKDELGEEEFKKLKNAPHWFGNLETACEEVGLKQDYVMCARLGSRALHATDYDEYVVESETTFSLGRDDKWLEAVMSSSCRLFTILLGSVNATFELGRESEMKTLLDRAETLHRRIGG
ncbi:DUF5677 domain-containing protein [Myxococcota bacterium]